ncbi:LOW QUALITY PROTEIN: HS12B-like protein [Mya arenaria]|uniref:HS12B-like protein n=1 Tax=Mya arenaria TaxID=6604 RepID=A0ABY7FT24_MYAAR|nr:LOW QUALITY PROTEIN: HS12B-like protein [Mya arenaria]
MVCMLKPQNVIRPGVMAAFKENHMEDYIDLFRDFEIKKRDISTKKSGGKINLRMPVALVETVKEVSGKTIKETIVGSAYRERIKHLGDKIRVDADLVIELFEEPVTSILNHVSTLLKESAVRGCNKIVMVGGFSESPILQERVKERFSGMSVIVPNEAGLAVLKGAVIFGHSPTAIAERVCKLTYGYKASHLYKKTCSHPTGRCEKDKNEDLRCYDIFTIQAKAGENVKLSQEGPESTFTPVSASQTTIALEIYASLNPNPSHTTEQRCSKIGYLNIPIDDTSLGKDREFGIRFIFGGTELEVKVEDKADKRGIGRTLMLEDETGKKGPGVMGAFKESHMEDYIELFRDFEIKKRDISTKKSGGKITLRMPVALVEIVKEVTGKTIKETIVGSVYGERIKHHGDKIRVDADIVIELFDEPVTSILNHVSTLLKESAVRGCNKIVMVGGFSESPILQERVKERFSGMSVIVPTEAGLAVLKGAVIVGHSPTTIAERVCKLTYGFASTHPREETCSHPKGRIERDANGDLRCQDIFVIQARAVDKVRLSEERPEIKARPVIDSQTGIGFDIVACSNPSPYHTTERGCSKIGHIAYQREFTWQLTRIWRSFQLRWNRNRSGSRRQDRQTSISTTGRLPSGYLGILQYPVANH